VAQRKRTFDREALRTGDRSAERDEPRRRIRGDVLPLHRRGGDPVLAAALRLVERRVAAAISASALAYVGNSATPKLAVNFAISSFRPGTSSSAAVRRVCSAERPAFASLAPGSTTTNSSPPERTRDSS